MDREQLLLELPGAKHKPVWKRWKWIGLCVFAAVLLFDGWLPGGLVVFGWFYGIVVILNLAFLLLRRLRNRLFWRVRHRLLGAFLFAGLIPLLLITGVVVSAGGILCGQLASDYLSESLAGINVELAWLNAELGAQIAQKPPAEFGSVAAGLLNNRPGFPVLAAQLLNRTQSGAFDVIARYDPSGAAKELEPYKAGLWDGARPSERLISKKNSLFILSMRRVPGTPALFLALAAPVERPLLEHLISEKSIYVTSTSVGSTRVTSGNSSITISTEENGTRHRDHRAERQYQEMKNRSNQDPRWKITWFGMPDCRDSDTGEVRRAIFGLEVPLAMLYEHYLAGSSEMAKPLTIIFVVLLVLFLGADLVSMVVGVMISRKITQSVHDMYQGILAFKQGNIEHKIPVRRNDQLGLLAHSFNQMGTSITRLLEEVSEKKRLEQELQIAREVQAALFPRQLPHPRGLSVFGGCEPARVVSGDYYDFIVEDDSRLHIVVGDISGKGISAALLMANLQAAMRNQLTSFKQAASSDMERLLASTMAELNHQIYLNSPSEKYATLFSSVYDAGTRRLYYCNAGHLPPVIICNGQTRKLEAGGTVLGLFPEASYQTESVELAPGAVLAIFTDGVTEAVNERDEEFGEGRLIETLRERHHDSPEVIYRNVTGRVQQWQGTLKQHDDITLIVAKVE